MLETTPTDYGTNFAMKQNFQYAWSASTK